MLDWWSDPEAEPVLACDGTVGGGKSAANTYGMMTHALGRLPGSDYVLASQTADLVKRNLESYLYTWAGALGLVVTPRGGPRRYEVTDPDEGLVNANFWVLGASDSRAWSRIRGGNLDGGLLDDMMDMHREFVEEVFARLRRPNTKLAWTLNPQGQNHWVDRHYLQDPAARGIRVVSSDMRDNPGVDPGYRDRLTALYGKDSVAYRRRVLGERADAAGLIWPGFSKAVGTPPPGSPSRYVIGVDEAHSTGVLHAVLLGEYRTGGPSVWWALDEVRYHHAVQGRLNDAQQAQMIASRWRKLRVSRVWVSPDAPALVKELRRWFPYTRPAVSELDRALRWINWRMNAGLVRVSSKCQKLIGEGEVYAWDPRAAERGEDRPLKGNDHGCDGFRYGLWSEACYSGSVPVRAREAARERVRPRWQQIPEAQPAVF